MKLSANNGENDGEQVPRAPVPVFSDECALDDSQERGPNGVFTGPIAGSAFAAESVNFYANKGEADSLQVPGLPEVGRNRRGRLTARSTILESEFGIPLSPAPSPVPSLRRRFVGVPHSPSSLFREQALMASDSEDEEGLHSPAASEPGSPKCEPMRPVQALAVAFRGLGVEDKKLALRLLLSGCDREVLLDAQAVLTPMLRHDPFKILPIEISLRILSYIRDPKSLAAASQVSRRWYLLLSDDSTWKKLCDTHHFRRLSAAGSHVALWRSSLGQLVPENAIESPKPESLDEDVENPQLSNHPPAAVSPGGTQTNGGTQINGGTHVTGGTQATGGTQRSDHLELNPDTPLETEPDELTNLNLQEAGYRPEALRLVKPTNYRSHFRQQYLLSSAWERGGNLAARYKMSNQDDVIVTTVLMQDDYIVMALDNSRILVFAADGKLLRSLYGHVMGVWALAMHGNALVSGGCDRDVREWDLSTGACRKILRGHSSTVRCLAMAGKDIAISGGRDATVRIWDLKNGLSSLKLVGHSASVRRLEVTDEFVISASYDCTVKIWRLDNGELVHTLSGHHNQIYSLAVDAPTNTVVTGSLDHTIRVWDLRSGACRATLQGHSALVGQLQLRGQTLVSGGSDGAVRVWDLSTGECVHRIAAHDNSVTCLQFDDERIVSGSPDGRIQVWSTRTGKHIRQIHARSFSSVWGIAFRDDRLLLVYTEGPSTVVELLSFVPTLPPIAS